MTSKRRRSPLFWLLALSLMLQGLWPAAPAAAAPPFPTRPEAKIHRELTRMLDVAEGPLTFLVMFGDQADTAQSARNAFVPASATAKERTAAVRKAVVSDLRSASDRSAAKVQRLIETLTVQGHITDVKPLWVINGLVVTGDRTAVLRLADHIDVASLAPDQKVLSTPPLTQPQSTTSGYVLWNLEMVGAPGAWELGANGTGVVVGIMDSGVDYNHPALKANFRGYNAANPGNPAVTGNWIDVVSGQPFPYDDVGHGTHVAGTVLGYDPQADLHIGVAPGAKWIAAKAFDPDGAYSSWLLTAGQWLMAPTDASGTPRPDWAPDIINNSWGSSQPGLNEFFRTMVTNWRNAGIFPVFSAGNEGPGTATVTAPGNYPESYSVAAVDHNRVVAPFSSRGPSPYTGVNKPDVSAPGVSIYSAFPGGGYAYGDGTSMAAPHVAGVAAAVLSVAPHLTPTGLGQVLNQTLTPLTDSTYPTSPNYGYGFGLVNAQAAAAAVAPVGTLNGWVRNSAGQPVEATLLVTPRNLQVTASAVDGTYGFRLPADSYTITASAYGYQPQSYAVTIARDQTVTQNFTLSAIPRGTLQGRIVDSTTQQPVPGATVSLVEDAKAGTAITDGDGRYSLTPMAGQYTLRVAANSYSPLLLAATVTANTTTTVDGALVPNQLRGDDWPQYRGGPGHTAYNDSVVAPPFATAWESPDATNGWQSPIIAAGHVYAVNNTDKSVYAFDAATGQMMWTRFIGGPYTVPGIAFLQGVLVAVGSDGKVYGYDSVTGAALWTRTLRQYSLRSAPSVADDLVYITGSGSGTSVAALDKSGNQVFDKSSAGGSAAFGEGLIFTAGSSSAIALDAKTGTQAWRWDCGCYLASDINTVYADGTVLVWGGSTSNPTLYALQAASGQIRWSMGQVSGYPAVWDGVAYVPLQSGQTAKVRLLDGKVQGYLPTGANGFVANGVYYAGNVTAYDLSTGTSLWSFAGSGTAAPVMGHSLLVAQKGTRFAAFAPITPVVTGSLAGVVQETGTGLPIPGSSISLVGTARRGHTSADGLYTLTAQADTYTVEAAAYGYLPVTQSVTVEGGRALRQDFALTPAPRGALKGQVLDADTGAPLIGAKLTLVEDARVGSVTSGAEGSYRVEAYSGSYTLRVVLERYFSVNLPVTIPAGGEATLTVQLRPIIARPDDWVTEYGSPDHRGQVESLATPPFTTAWQTSGISITNGTRPVVGNGRVFINVTGHGLQAYDLATGQLLWSQAGTNPEVSPAYDRERVYIINGDNKVTAYAADSGELLWSRVISQSWGDTSPTAIDGKVYVTGSGSGSTLYAMDGASGALLWSKSFSGGDSSPAVVNGVVYVSGGGPKIYAYEAETGNLIWFHDGCGGCSAGGDQTTVVGEGLVLLVDFWDNELLAIDAESGLLRWKKTGMASYSTPAVVDGMIYAHTGSNTVAQIRPEDGTVVKTLTLSGRLAAGGGYLYGNGVTAVRLSDGSSTSHLSGATDVIVAEDLVLAINSSRNLVVLRPTTQVQAGLLHGSVTGNSTPKVSLSAEIRAGGRTVTTNSVDGTFSLRLPAGTYTVEAGSPRWLTGSKTVTITAGGVTRTDFLLEPEPHGSATGALTDALTGAPVTGARATLAEDLKAQASQTGTSSQYHLSWYAGSYTLRVEAPGYRTAYVPITLTPGAQATVNVSLVPGPAGDCPVDRCTPSRDGQSTTPGATPYSAAWSNTLVPVGTPVVAEGVAFVSHAGGSLTAVNLFTGETIWHQTVTTINGWAPSSPAYGDGMVFVADDNYHVYGFNARTGQQLWKYNIGQHSTATPPIYYQGRVYVGGSGTGATVAALDARTGQHLWSQGLHSSVKTLAIGGGRVYAAAYGPRVYAFDVNTGSPLWFTNESGGTSGGEDYELTYADEVLIIRPEVLEQNQLIAYNAATGVRMWQNYGGIPAVKDGVYYTHVDGTLRAVDLQSGNLIWTLPVTASGSARPPVIVGNTLLLGNAVAVDLVQRQVVWQYAGGGQIPPVPAEGFLLVTSSSGNLTALRAAATARVTVLLNGLADRGGTTVTVTGGGQTWTGLTDSTGAISFPGVPAGTYTVTATRSGYVGQTVTAAFTALGGEAGVSLAGGDFNDDGRIDLADMDLLLQHWGTTNAAYDLVPDGRIDLRDLSVLAHNIQP